MKLRTPLVYYDFPERSLFSEFCSLALRGIVDTYMTSATLCVRHCFSNAVSIHDMMIKKIWWHPSISDILLPPEILYSHSIPQHAHPSIAHGLEHSEFRTLQATMGVNTVLDLRWYGIRVDALDACQPPGG